MLNIAGYQIIATLYQGRHSIIYRGAKTADTQQSVIIKVPATIPLSKQQIDKLRQEFELRQRIISDHVVKFLELKPDITYGYLLIEEDDHADTLINHLPKNGFEPLPFLNMAIQLVEGLGDIHRSRVVHKDIKPHNIIYLPNTGQVKYIDFNSASLLHQQQQVSMLPMPTTEATLAYISPEQTGRINRLIDYRTDFYSLGVTFYQLLCGRWPFEGKKVAELVYCHLAKQPLFPHAINSTIPKPLSDIVMKLLQKDAEARYQSAYGLLVDLKRCQEELTQKGEILPFILAEHDISEYFYIPQKLYGREAELSVLAKCYEHASQEQPQIVMIAGPAGAGKSVLVQEIQPIIAAQQGYFLIGKFESSKRNIAYSAITQAFQMWIQQILALSEEEIATWRNQLLAALNEQGQLLIDILPDFELILGKQPSVPTLEPEQTKHRFQRIFQQFITVLAQPAHPLVVFLDDWQWADDASLNLLAAIMTNPDTKSLLLIGAYRDNEVDASHPALMALGKLQKEGIAMQTLSLSPLKMTAINQWIADATHHSTETTLPLTNLLYQKTEGLPFFIKVFLQAIYDQGLLIFSEGHWDWDLEKIGLLPVTENVTTFMIQQVQQLPPAAQETLQFAACLGHRFYFSQLVLVTQKPVEQLEAELQPLVDKGFLLQGGDTLKFAHDRIQEAAYQQIPVERRASLHLTIGHLMQADLHAEVKLEQLMAIVNHLNQGKALITDHNEQLSLAQLNFETAQKAKASAAYATTLDYLRAGESYLLIIGKDRIWQEHHSLAYKFYKALAEAEYLNNHFEFSENYITHVLERAQTVLEKVDIYILSIIQKTVMAHYQEAIDVGYQALNLLSVNLQGQDLQHLLQIELDQVKEGLKNKTTQMLFDASCMTDDTIKAMMKLLDNLIAASYIGNPPLHALIAAMMVNLTLCYGNTEESAFGYSSYGMLLVAKLNEIELAYNFGLLAIQLSEKFHHPISQCRSNFVHGIGLHSWRKPLREAEIYFNRAQQVGLEAGDFQYLGYLLQAKLTCFFYQGTPLTTIEPELRKLLRFPYIRANQSALGSIHALQLVIFNFKGQTPDETAFQDDNKTDADYQTDWQQAKNFYVLTHYLIFKAQALYMHEQFEKALEALLSAQPSLKFVACNIVVSAHNFYHSLALAALYPSMDNATQQRYWQQIEVNQKQMKRWADYCPENFLHKYLLISAEMARIIDNRLEAEEKYEQAIQAAEQQGFIQEHALASELAAKYCLAQHKPNYAKGLLQAAYQLYERWGAQHKVNQLIIQYRELLKPLSPIKLSSFSISEEETISAISLRLLDLTSILKTSQTISSEVDLAKLLIKIMNCLIENAGAQKGAFLVEEAGQLRVQAEYTPKGQLQTLQQLPFSQWDGGAHSIIECVRRTQQSLLLGNASTDSRFNQDPYVNSHHTQSILCLPVIRHHQFQGILYLENNLAPYMFTEQHLQVLTILASQITISLENARYFSEQLVLTRQLVEQSTRAKMAEESLQAITHDYKLALDASKAGTWTLWIDSKKVTWDDANAALFGLQSEEFGGNYEAVIERIHPDDRAQMQEAVKRCIEEDIPYDLESRVIWPDGSQHVIAGKGCVYRDKEGRPIKMAGVCINVTQRKQLEEERLQALKQAEEKERHRAEEAEKYRKNLENFIAMVCHEIRNPMSGIYGNVDFLQEIKTFLRHLLDKVPLEIRMLLNGNLNKLDEIIKDITQCIKHQKAIIDDVLDLSKLEAGRMEFAHQPFRLKTLIEEVAHIYAAPLAQKKLPLRLSLPAEDLWVKGDVNRLKMVLMNLMGNALKFTEQGEIKINLQLINVSPTHTTFALSVKDTGIGMTTQEQDQLFQRFSRVASAEYEGSGLGLMISKRFIQQMGGRIDVNSEKGKGSQFTIQLTCETAPAEIAYIPLTARAAPAPSPIVLPITKRILIVEDNVMNQKILRRHLETAGYYCEVANNGQEAVDKWVTGSFDFIFMDIEMPVMGGFEATKAIRAREQQLDIARKIPIVALSAYASKEFVQQAHSVGMDDYITKPYEKNKLLEAVKTWTTQPSDPSPSTDTLLALNLVQNLTALQPIITPTSTGQTPLTKSAPSFWSTPQPAPTQPTKSARTWMPQARRNALYPVLDRLTDALTTLKVSIIKPEAKYQSNASHTGWQLYYSKETDECLAVLNFEQEAHVDHLLEIIRQTDTPLQARKMHSGPAHLLAIDFNDDNRLITGIEKFIFNIQAQRRLQPISH